MVTRDGVGVYWGSVGPSERLHILGPPIRADSMRKTTTKFCTVIKLDVDKVFTRLTRDLSAVAELVSMCH